jgi:hypothetical protein
MLTDYEVKIPVVDEAPMQLEDPDAVVPYSANIPDLKRGRGVNHGGGSL